jgi:hypothetical protein
VEDGVEHGLGELAREGVLLAHVEAADDPAAATQVHLDAVGELGTPGHPEDPAQPLVREGAERHEHAGVEQLELPLEVRATGIALRGRGLVGRWRAAHRRGDPCPGETKAIAAVGARRLVGEARAVQRRVEEVTGAVAGEHASCAVGAVSRWRQPTITTRASGSPNAGTGRPQ